MDTYTRQLELEDEMLTLGMGRFRKQDLRHQEKSTYSSSATGAKIVGLAIQPTSDAICEFMDKARSGRAGRRHIAVKMLEEVDPDVAAFMTCQCVVDTIIRPVSVQKVAQRIGNMIEDEIRFTRFSEEMPGYFKVTTENLNKKSSHYRHKSLVLRAMMDRYGVEWEPWNNTDKVHLGLKLVELFMVTTGLVELGWAESKRGRKSASRVLRATPKCLEAIKDRNAKDELLCPVLLPMVHPPRPWSSPKNGGYLRRDTKALTLVKSRNQNYLEELANWDMPEVYDAVNRMMDVRYRVHPQVLEVVTHFRNIGVAIGGLPRPIMGEGDVDLPDRPVDIDTNEVARKEWRMAAALAYTAHNQRVSQNMATDQTLWVADKFKDDDIYFIWNMDFRGRCYVANSPALSPQGDDLQRGLLMFSEGKEITTDDGGCWLAIQLANSFGADPSNSAKVDRLSLQDRVDWAVGRLEDWRRVAADPIGNLLWTEAEKPWQALAAILEFVGYMDARDLGEPFVSHLIVSMDGSNNGLQHMAALVRDEESGALVNLVPSDTPSDIYQVVADEVVSKLRGEADQSHVACYYDPSPVEAGSSIRKAQQWLDLGITRKVVKRPVMTYSYSATLYGFADQIMVDTVRPLVVGGEDPFEGNEASATMFLARVLWDAIESKVTAAAEVMRWLREVSRLVASEGLPIHWVAPSGFPVQQSYRQTRDLRVKTHIAGSRMRVTVREDLPVLDKRKQQAGISPNFVHSMDAAAMIKTINLSAEHGLTAWAMVHDSYGTHAEDAPRMAECLRFAFVEMYRDDVLLDFRKQILDQLHSDSRDQMPDLPEYGSLDLLQVEESDFFFA